MRRPTVIEFRGANPEKRPVPTPTTFHLVITSRDRLAAEPRGLTPAAVRREVSECHWARKIA